MTFRTRLSIWTLLAVLLASCGKATSQAPNMLPTPTSELFLPTIAATPTATPLPPTPTPEPPAAAHVNGQPITLEAYQKELARYNSAQLALGRNPEEEDTSPQIRVLDALIEQALILQAAATEGIKLDDKTLDAELQRLIEATGGQENFNGWLEANQYTPDEFREVLRAQMTVQAMITEVTGSIGDAAEQVHARHIVVASEETIEAVLNQLEQGTDFATLAKSYSLDESTGPNGGDLGWFPRGLLLSPEVEDAAFALEAGEISGIVESGFGYHLVQVLEKDPARPVTLEIERRLREVAFDNWLQQLWETAMVERNI